MRNPTRCPGLQEVAFHEGIDDKGHARVLAISNVLRLGRPSFVEFGKFALLANVHELVDTFADANANKDGAKDHGRHPLPVELGTTRDRRRHELVHYPSHRDCH